MNHELGKIGRIGLYTSVFITGASVMIVELLGTRLIAPFYGNSLYVWSSLIAVAMIALSIGYYSGGIWADRSKKTGLSLVIGLAGILILLIPWLNKPVLLATDSLGLREGAFSSALLLFSPSLTFLGMVSPFAIKRATLTLEGVGASAGSLYAVSTVGSVTGTLMLGFYLFPLFGSREILIVLGLGLIVLASIIGLYEKKALKVRHAFWPCLLLLILGMMLVPEIINADARYQQKDQFEIQFEEESLYGWVRVIDEPSKDLRILTSDASVIGAASISSGQSLLAYQQIVSLIPKMRPSMKKALIIGLGAGHMANQLKQKYNIQVDTLEIDPAVSYAAFNHFDFQSSGKDIVGDARYEIRKLANDYDLIIHDCFTGGTEPSHLLTKETLDQLKTMLTDNGILAINFVSFWNKGQNKALSSVAKTIAQTFSEQMMLMSEPEGGNFNDFIFLASKQVIRLQDADFTINQRRWIQTRLRKQSLDYGVVLTDNYNPLEYLQVGKSEHYRQVILDWFGTDLLLR